MPRIWNAGIRQLIVSRAPGAAHRIPAPPFFSAQLAGICF
jgi:hypothetical protein